MREADMDTPHEGRDREAVERKLAWAKGLRARFDKVAREPVPDRFHELLKQLEEAESDEQ